MASCTQDFATNIILMLSLIQKFLAPLGPLFCKKCQCPILEYYIWLASQLVTSLKWFTQKGYPHSTLYLFNWNPSLSFREAQHFNQQVLKSYLFSCNFMEPKFRLTETFLRKFVWLVHNLIYFVWYSKVFWEKWYFCSWWDFSDLLEDTVVHLIAPNS